MGKDIMPVEKITFKKNIGLLFSARQKILNNFKSKMFPTKNHESEPIPEKEQTKNHKLADFWKKLYGMNQILVMKYLANILGIKIHHIY